MAVLRLELDIDSDVYPVLHARLQAIQSRSGRAECLRQLAASGLVCETLRLEQQKVLTAPPVAPHTTRDDAAAHDAHLASGNAASARVSPAEIPPSRAAPSHGARHPDPHETTHLAHEAPRLVPHETPRLVPTPHVVAHPASAAPLTHALRPAANAQPSDADFIDLAIGTVLAAPTYDTPAPWDGEDRRHAAGKRLPVLGEVVEPHVLATADAHRAAASAAAHGPRGWQESLDAAAASHRATDDVRTVPEASPDDADPAWGHAAPRSAPSTRLMRMKERGLFNNR